MIRRMGVTATLLMLGSPLSAQELRARRDLTVEIALVQRARDSIAVELEQALPAARVKTVPPGWRASVRAVERRLNLDWRGPEPILLLVSDGGTGFRCRPGAESGADRCRGRTEAVRARDETDSTVAIVMIFASSAWLERDVWEHELTHALLIQHGFVRESAQHDARRFARR